MFGAFSRGIFAMNGALDFVCPSANCTWPDFTTLAICNDCRDVTSSTQVEKKDCAGDEIRWYGDQNIIQCRKFDFSLPNGALLSGVVGLQNATGKSGSTWLSSVVSTQLNVNISSGDIEGAAAKIIAVNMAQFRWNSSWDFDTTCDEMASTFKTMECDFSWCIKRYTGVNVVCGQKAIYITDFELVFELTFRLAKWSPGQFPDRRHPWPPRPTEFIKSIICLAN